MPEKNHQKIIVVSVMKFVWYLLQCWIQGGGAVIQTLRKGGGGLQENFFGPFGPQFGLKIREGRPPRSLPWIYHCSTTNYRNIVCTALFDEHCPGAGDRNKSNMSLLNFFQAPI